MNYKKKKKVFEVSDNSTVFNKSNKLKNLNSEEKKFLAKSSSFKEKEKRTSKNISKTPDKKKINFQSKFENFKSETNLFDDEKNEVWQREKEKEEDDLINELKEEYEEGGESELSYDSEEMDDEDMISYVQKNEKKEEEKKVK